MDFDGELACFDCDDTLSWVNHRDDDEDGYSPCDGDCLDWRAAVNPGADEDPCDGYDTNCDGVMADDELDQDDDGQRACEGDCDDLNATVETLDRDGDGFTTCDGDCLDTIPVAHPGLVEVCDGWDNDCDGTRDDVPFTGTFPTEDVLIDDVSWATLYGELEGDGAGRWVTGLGDMNGDGYGDIAVATQPVSDVAPNRAARVHIVYGPVCGETSLALEPEGVSGAEVIGNHWQTYVSYVGDVNGDGLDDLHMFGRIFFGPLAGTLSFDADWDIAITNWTFSHRPFPLEIGADLNGDSIGDLVVGDPSGGVAGRVAIFHGPLTPGIYDIEQADGMVLGDPDHPLGFFGYAFASPGDLDGDGFDDLVVGAYRDSGEEEDPDAAFGSAYVFAGPIAGTRMAEQAEGTLRGTIEGGAFGMIVESAGDMDGDGELEFAVVATGEPFVTTPGGAAVYVFGGLPTGTETAAPGALGLPLIEGNGGQLKQVASGTDLTGDGRPDLVVPDEWWGFEVAGWSGRVASVSTLTGTPVFLNVGGEMDKVATQSDVNGDGTVDLLVAGSVVQGVVVSGVRIVLGTPPSPARFTE